MCMTCPYCGEHLAIEQSHDGRGQEVAFELQGNGEVIGTYRTRVKLSGCRHADAWNRGPEGGPGLPLPRAA